TDFTPSRDARPVGWCWKPMAGDWWFVSSVTIACLDGEACWRPCGREKDGPLPLRNGGIWNGRGTRDCQSPIPSRPASSLSHGAVCRVSSPSRNSAECSRSTKRYPPRNFNSIHGHLGPGNSLLHKNERDWRAYCTTGGTTIRTYISAISTFPQQT